MHISFRQHTLRFKQPAGTSRGVYRERRVWYVVAGGVGIGECAPLHDLSCDAMPPEDYERVLGEACRRTEEACNRCEDYCKQSEEDDNYCGALLDCIPYDFLRPYPSVLFGLETALRSFAAFRRTGNPFQLYDNAFSRGETGITINGLVWMGSFEEMMERMEEKLALGFRCIKLKIGAIDWEREISLIRALRERYPREVVEIRVDANGGFTPDVAMERLRELSLYGIHSIEQPIRQGQWAEMARLCRETPVPIALDEELIGVNDPQQKIELLDAIRPQYIILKPSLHGGIAGSEEWIRLAEARGIGHWATSALESNVGLNAIAQWCGEAEQKMPSGLGTGQLFVENFEGLHLSIEGEQLWCGSAADRAFRADLRQFLAEWAAPASTIEVQTSGSTGTPQKMRVEKRRMEASARMTLGFLGLRRGDVALLCMPLRYIAGKMMAVRAIVGGLRLQLVAPSRHPLEALAAASRLSDGAVPAFLAVTPMQALATLEVEAERAVFERIPVVIIGGGPVSPELHAALQTCRGRIFSTYGMTETLSHIAMRRLNGPEQSDRYTPLPGVTVCSNAAGCLVIDAPAVAAMRLTTNDLCECFSDGTFRILGRRDNVVCSGGIKFSLEALEEKIGPLDVDYLLTSVPDALLGEALVMLYVPRPAESPAERPSAEMRSAPLDQCTASLDQRSARLDLLRSRLDRYEMPRHFFAVDSLPLTETGKPARAEARRKAASLIDAQSVR